MNELDAMLEFLTILKEGLEDINNILEKGLEN